MSAHDQEQADIGQEANEREMRDLPMWNPAITEADEQALVGSILAQLGWAVDDLTTPDHVAILVDADREGLAKTVAALDRDILLLATTRDEVARTLANLMEDDAESIAGMLVTRSRSDKVEWDKDGCWRAARFSIADRWGDGAHVERVLTDISTAFALTPRVGGLKTIGVNAHEYRAVTRGTHYAVKVQGAPRA